MLPSSAMSRRNTVDKQPVGEDAQPSGAHGNGAEVVGAGDEGAEPSVDVHAEDPRDPLAPAQRGALADAPVGVGPGRTAERGDDGPGLAYGVLAGGRVEPAGRGGVGHGGTVAEGPDVCVPADPQARSRRRSGRSGRAAAPGVLTSGFATTPAVHTRVAVSSRLPSARVTPRASTDATVDEVRISTPCRRSRAVVWSASGRGTSARMPGPASTRTHRWRTSRSAG